MNFEETIQEKFNHNVTKKNLKEKTQQILTLSINGGTFKLTSELFAMLYLFQDQKEIVLEDSFGNPILIKDISEFTYKCKIKYNEVMNEWLTEYDRIKRVRKPEQV